MGKGGVGDGSGSRVRSTAAVFVRAWYPGMAVVDIDGGRLYETMLVTCPRHLVAFGYCGRGGAEDLFVGFPGAAFDIVRRGSLFGEPMVVRLAIHADGTVTLTDILAEMRERDAFSRW
jgi:hypothetical protein